MKKHNNRRKVIFLLFVITIIIITFIYIYKTDSFNHFYSYLSDDSMDKNEVKMVKKQINFLFFKKEKKLELWLNSDTGVISVRHYDVIIANQELGPKTVNNSPIFPEGVYFVTEYDENNLKFSFPNEFDKIKAKADNRILEEKNILFGTALNNGSFSLKKEVLDYFYLLVKTENIEDIRLISSPIDFRKAPFIPSCYHCPHWTNELYSQIKLELNHFTFEKK